MSELSMHLIVLRGSEWTLMKDNRFHQCFRLAPRVAKSLPRPSHDAMRKPSKTLGQFICMYEVFLEKEGHEDLPRLQKVLVWRTSLLLQQITSVNPSLLF